MVGSGDSFFLGHAAIPAFEYLAGVPAEAVVAHPSTQDAVALADAVRSRVEVPVLIGSYSNHENVSRLLEHADGAIVGGVLKKDADQEWIGSEKVRSHVRLARGG